MTHNTVTILSPDKFRFVKIIQIISDYRKSAEITLGYIIYKRLFATDYKFKEVPKEERDVSYYVQYPQQNLYPVDNVDNIILQAVKNLFPKSEVRNDSIISSMDLEKIEMFQKRPHENSLLTLTPDFSSIDILSLTGKQFPCIRKQIKIYNDFSKDEIQNMGFFGHYKLDDKEVLDKIDAIEFI
jgi:hypothetical protein